MMAQAGTAWMAALMQPAMQAALAKAGYEFDPAPLVIMQNQNLFGAYLGNQVLINQRELLTVPPEIENQMLSEGHHVHVHPLDQDVPHLQSHTQDIQQNGDEFGTKQEHIAAHLQSMQMKNMAAMQQAQAQAGGGAPAGPGGQRGPQPGALPAGPHAQKRPPGLPHPDQGMQSGVVAMPRRT